MKNKIPILYTKDEVADILKVNTESIKHQVRMGYIKPIKVCGKWRFKEEEVARYIRMCKAPKIRGISKMDRILNSLKDAGRTLEGMKCSECETTMTCYPCDTIRSSKSINKLLKSVEKEYGKQ